LRWLAVPWSEFALASALVLAFAIPVLLVGSVDVWRAASEDDLTERSVDDVSLARNGLDIAVEARFSRSAVRTADQRLGEALAGIPRLEDPVRTAYTYPGLFTVGPPPVREVGPVARLLTQSGALDAVDVLTQLDDTSHGVWISTSFSDQLGVELGDPLAFEVGVVDDVAWNDLVSAIGSNAVFRVVGLYEPVWSADASPIVDEYWSTIPPELLPVYVAAFRQPNFELVLTEEATLLSSGLPGVVRWRAPLESMPTTFDGLRALRDRVRGLDGSLVTAGALGASMKELASGGQRAPVLTSDVFETTSSVETAVAQLASPLASARALGAAIGFAVVIAAGVFLVERRRTEFRLLASEGERWPRMAARVAGQLAAVALVGGVVGVLLAVAGPRWFGPAVSYDFARVPWTYVALTTGVALLLASVSAGVMGARTLVLPSRQTRRAVSRVLVVTLIASTVVAWVQVGRTTASRGASIDLVAVALPVLVIAFVVLVVVEALGWAVRLLGRRGERLPVEVFLASRRLASGSLAVRLVAGSLGIGIGLLVFALAITATLDRTLDVKLATSVGGASSLTLLDDLPPTYRPPAPTTVIAESDTRLMPGAVQGRVIAIDPATYADAVTWSDQFGADVDEVLAALAGPSDESIPVIAIEGEPVPSEGAFGLTRSYPYRVVATVRGFPTAGNRNVSLMASADAIEAYAAEVGNEGARSPLDAFRETAVSQASAEALTQSLDDAGVRYRDVVSQLEQRQSPSIVATRSAFGFLGAIGITAAAAACVALGLFLSARRRSRALTGVITRSMGLSAPRTAMISAIELGSVLLVSVAAGFIAAPLVVSRLSPRFDPAPGRPPTVNVLVDWLPLVVGALVGVFVVAGLVWLSEWRESRRPAGAVVRDAD
jgi:hypothetical protein